MDQLSLNELEEAVRRALTEDIGSGDVTTLATVPEKTAAQATMVAREPIVLAGIQLAIAAFRQLSSNLDINVLAKDGESISEGGEVLQISGLARPILSAERVALNFVQRLSGIATLTAQFVAAVRGTSAQILDTRKTTPGWRRLEKYAVRCGGGQNHRHGLFDMVMIKDNHLAALSRETQTSIETAVRQARERYPDLKVEVEAESLRQVEESLQADADIVLLDNMKLDDLRAAVALAASKAKLEASGGVTLSTVRAIAETGVDYISVGALTHSARAVDIALDFEMNR